MKTLRVASAAAVLLAAAVGCSEIDLCAEKNADGESLCSGPTGTGGASSGTDGGGGSSGTHAGGAGGEGAGGGAPANCDPTLGAVDGSCGIFVSSSLGKDNNAGTKTSPVKSLGHAVELAQGKGGAVYACAEVFVEAVVLPAGMALHGALDCKHGWMYAAASPTRLTGPADRIPLTLAPGGETTRVIDLSIQAVDATSPGGSSLAVLANGATAELARCSLLAGKGAAGAAGAHQDDLVTPADADGKAGGAGCTSNADVSGGAHGNNACASPAGGGSGGTGTNTLGSPGGDGAPQPMGTAPKDGKGGPGDAGTGCFPGDPGAPGPDGGAGAGATALGTLSATGYASPTATDGLSAGTPGQGGGGGGGAGLCGAANAGPSGGGGGAGGCGGVAGKAGTSGGSSIALASFNAHVTLTDSSLTAGRGGDGGPGGDGQKGGAGGDAGARGGANACPGGVGGKGGRGGSAGGGAGGNSLAIAFQGGAAPKTTNTMAHADAPGAGAAGGDANAAAKGADGLPCATLDLGDPTSCAL